MYFSPNDFSPNHVLLQMLQSDWLRYSLCLFLVFRNNFEKMANTSWFLLKQLDYSLSISMKRWLTQVFTHTFSVN